MAEDRLNKTISDIAYILDSLILLRQIQQTGDCNNCQNKDCGYKPKAGQMVRYNCPFYKAKERRKNNERRILGIVARLQAIKEITSNVCEVKDYENIAEFCDEIHNLVNEESEG